MRPLLMFAMLGFIWAAACSATGEAGKTRGSRYSVSLAEIRTSSATNLYDLIRSLRPHWLQGRGSKSIMDEDANLPVVYVDGGRHGTLDALEELSTEGVAEIRFLNARDATTRYGTGHTGGVILVRTR